MGYIAIFQTCEALHNQCVASVSRASITGSVEGQQVNHLIIKSWALLFFLILHFLPDLLFRNDNTFALLWFQQGFSKKMDAFLSLISDSDSNKMFAKGDIAVNAFLSLILIFTRLFQKVI